MGSTSPHINIKHIDNILLTSSVSKMTFIPVFFTLSCLCLYISTILSLPSLKVDVCAAVSGVRIPSSVGKQMCTVWCTEGGSQPL